MQRPASELRELVSGAVLFRLGRAMAATLGPLARILAAGAERGVFAIDDPDFMANRLYTQCSARCISRAWRRRARVRTRRRGDLRPRSRAGA